MRIGVACAVVLATALAAPVGAHAGNTDMAGIGIGCSTEVVEPGGTYTCGVSYANQGPNPIVPADGYRIVTFDVGFSDVTAVSSPEGTCSLDGANPSCVYGSIPPGGTVTMTAEFRANPLAAGFDEEAVFEGIEATDTNRDNDRLVAVVRIRERQAPDTSLSKDYRKLSRKKAKKAKWGLGATVPGSSFVCKVDSKPYRPCTSPVRAKTTKKLGRPGKHTLCARAIAPSGEEDPSPACDRFKVKKK